jgi:arabinogalactan endo-1,4-beta-galactosidase
MRHLPRLALIVPLLAAPAAAPAAPDPFVRGADVSMLLELEKAGAVHRDAGQPRDAVRILRDRGVNLFRLRLFVDPAKEYAKCWGATQDLDAVRTLARRVKAAGAAWLLDFHYSDTWADPAHQDKPVAWKGLDFPALEKQVEEYTAGVVDGLRRDGLLPDWIQVGNEITPGFLWPDGKLDSTDASWDRFARLLRAGLRGARRPLAKDDAVRLMLHIDRGGDAETVRWFFERLAKRDVTDFDLVGLSYYPWWHGTLEDLKKALQAAAATGRDVVVVETAYPSCGEAWAKEKNMAWPATPEGQKQLLFDVLAAVRATPGGRGRGVVYWYPEAIPVKGLSIWNNGTTGLFGPDGAPLPALEAFAPR